MLHIAATLLLVTTLVPASLSQDVGRGSTNRGQNPGTVPQRIDTEAYRTAVLQFYGELRASINMLADMGFARQSNLVDILAGLEAEERRVSSLSATDLMIMRTSFVDQNTLVLASKNMRTLRTSSQNRSAFESARRADLWLKANDTDTSKKDPGGIHKAITPDVCPDPSVVPSVTDLAVLEGFVIAEEAIMEALPTDFLSVVAHAAAAVVVGATKVALLAAKTIYDIDTNCVWAAYRATTLSKLDLQFRADIEANLAGLGGPIVLYYTPSANGGYLELARTIVSQSITNSTAGGQPVGYAADYLAAADQYIALGQYKDAYTLLRLAYQQMIN